jgi:phospholipid/cholesterol/gamma-HCH transport system substrate-binding protein
MKGNIIETLMGALVILLAFGFVIFAYNSAGSNVSTKKSYSLIAKFEQADGISTGVDVKIGGIKIGAVTGQYLDPETYLATLTMAIDDKIKLPIDSSAQIVSEGLLGGKYIAIIPGAEDEMFKSKGEIKYTQSSVNLETLIGKFIFNSVESAKKDEGQSKSDSALPASTQ